MSRFTSLASALLFTSLLGLGCDDDDSHPIEPPIPEPSTGLEFKKLDEAQRLAAIGSGAGLGGAYAFFAVMGANMDSADQGSTCPTRSDVDGVTSFAATSCVGPATGDTYSGRVETVNSPASGDFTIEGQGVDPSKPTEMRFEDFVAGDYRLDGSFWQSSPAPTGPYTSKYDLTTDIGAKIHVNMELACTPAGCASLPGAAGELIGVGTFAISNTTQLDEDSAQVGGILELRGKDVLRVDFAVEDAEGCTPYTIDGVVAGKICQEELPEPEPEPEPEPMFFFGSGLGCGGDEGWEVHTYVLDGATSVDALVVQGDAEIAVSLVKGEADPFFEDIVVHTWSASNVTVPASFTCELENVSVRYDAVFADGSTVCYISGDATRFENNEACVID